MFVPPLNQNEAEFEELLSLYRTFQPKRVLEIGSYEGGTLFHWLQNAVPGAHIGSIDIQRLNKGHYDEWTPDGVTLNFYTGDSREDEAIQFAMSLYPIDFLFIDGGHEYEVVSHDFRKYGSLVKPGGIIALHDIHKDEPYIGNDGRVFPNEVKRLWEEVSPNKPRTTIIKDHPEWGFGPGIGVLFIAED